LNKAYIIFIITALLIAAINSCSVPDENINYIQEDLSIEEDQYLDEDTLLAGDQDEKEKGWDITFSFYGVINRSSSEESDLQKGDGKIIIENSSGNSTIFGSSAWAVKKYINMGNNSVPMIQILWTDNTDNGTNDYYILQLEGISVQHKNETPFVSNDRFLKAIIAKTDSEVTSTCFSEEPDDGRVYFLSHDIRYGEYIEIKGEVNMKQISPHDCVTN